MAVTQLIIIAIQVSMALVVFCVALNASKQEITHLLQKPWLLARSLIAMNGIMPLVAVAIVLLFDLNPIVEVALIATALSPVPPILPNRQLKAGGGYSYILGVLAVTAVFSIVFVPLAAEVLGRAFGRPVHISASVVAKIVLSSLLAPLAAGVVFKLFFPHAAKRIAQPLSLFALLLLVMAFIPVLVMQWSAIAALLGDFTLIVIAVFVLIGLLVGHWLGGPIEDDRTVLALATAMRHPAVAIAIIHDVPDRQAAMAAILLILLFGAIVATPYVKWRSRKHHRWGRVLEQKSAGR